MVPDAIRAFAGGDGGGGFKDIVGTDDASRSDERSHQDHSEAGGACGLRLAGGRSRTSRGEISIGTVSVKNSGVQGVKSYLLPLQPPMLTLTLVPLACAADTNRLSISGDEEGSSKANLNFWSGITKAKSIQSKRVMSVFSGGMVAETSQDRKQKLAA